MLKLSLDDLYITIRPPVPAPTAAVDALEDKLKFNLPTGFRSFLTTIGPCQLSGIEILAPEQILEKTESIGAQLKAYGLEAIPESLASESLNKAVLLADSNIFCHPKVADRIYRIDGLKIEEIGTSFDDLIDAVRERRGPSLRRLHATPIPCPNHSVKHLMSARRKHCFDAVHLMLAPQNPEAGETLEYDSDDNRFLIGLTSINGTIACSCQPEDYRVRIDYDNTCSPEALASVLKLLNKLGYVEPGAAVGDSPSSTPPGIVTEDVTFANERIITTVQGYGLDKGPIAGDLVFTDCRLLFFHSYEKEVNIEGLSIQDLLSAGLRYDVYEYTNIRKLVLKRNLFGRSVAVVVPKNAAKNKFWGPKRNLDGVLATQQELRELGLALHIAL